MSGRKEKEDDAPGISPKVLEAEIYLARNGIRRQEEFPAHVSHEEESD